MGFFFDLLRAGGGAVVLAGFIKWFGDKWFDQRFRMKVETFKAAHQKELAALKAEQDKKLAELRQKHESDLARLTHRLNSRISKVNEKEFEVLREVWSKVNMSHGSTQKVIWGFKYRHILSRLPAHQVEELLSELGLKGLKNVRFSANPIRNGRKR